MAADNEAVEKCYNKLSNSKVLKAYLNFIAISALGGAAYGGIEGAIKETERSVKHDETPLNAAVGGVFGFLAGAFCGGAVTMLAAATFPISIPCGLHYIYTKKMMQDQPLHKGYE